MMILKIERRITKDEFWDIFNKWIKDCPRVKVKSRSRNSKPKQTPEERKEKRRIFYENNKQRLLTYQTEYHLKNRDKRLKQMLDRNKRIDNQ